MQPSVALAGGAGGLTDTGLGSLKDLGELLAQKFVFPVVLDEVTRFRRMAFGLYHESIS